MPSSYCIPKGRALSNDLWVTGLVTSAMLFKTLGTKGDGFTSLGLECKGGLVALQTFLGSSLFSCGSEHYHA